MNATDPDADVQGSVLVLEDGADRVAVWPAQVSADSPASVASADSPESAASDD
ncbi:MAG: hypothetical protein ACRD0W_14380 [Acidimicrobiales bacterium]